MKDKTEFLKWKFAHACIAFEENIPNDPELTSRVIFEIPISYKKAQNDTSE